MDFVYAIIGLVILVLAGDSLVRGAVNVSLRLGIPALIVSLTIVAIGTSAPELLVAVSAVLDGAPGIAIGNVVGSNTANVLLVLGLPAMLVGLHTAGHDTRRSYVHMLIATALFVLVAFLQPIYWVTGLILLGYFILIMLLAIRDAMSHRSENADNEIVEGADEGMRWAKIWMYLALGLIGLPIGAHLLVESATNIARAFSISETVIGLTLVAVGTSLPELATTISAAFRRQADVALGNVIGSNIANLLAIVGVASLFGEIPVTPQIMSFDIWVMVGVSLILIPFVYFNKNITRGWGVALTGLYAVYVVQALI